MDKGLFNVSDDAAIHALEGGFRGPEAGRNWAMCVTKVCVGANYNEWGKQTIMCEENMVAL